MIPVASHLERILASVRPLPSRTLPIAAALGRVLAQDVRSLVDLPTFDNSAMDGYAVRVDDLEQLRREGSAVLPVAADVPAGDKRRLSVSSGTAVRIMTGAPMPEDADAIVPVEATDAGTTQVTVHELPERGRHIRRRAEDVAVGDVVLTAGDRLSPRHLALLAACGHGSVRVHPAPRVLVLSTGDELVPAGTVPGFGEVVDSNGAMIAACVRDLGAEAVAAGGVADTEEAVAAALGDLSGVDAVVTTGGVSMGAYDAVKAVLSRAETMRFDQVAMQPGKPQGFGTYLGVPVFTLPGNPVSSYVSFEVFVGPALRVMAGRPAHEVRLVRAVVERGWDSPRGKTQFARGTLRRRATHHGIEPVGGQGSHILGGLAQANALVVVPPDVGRVVAGVELACLPVGPIPVETTEAR